MFLLDCGRKPEYTEKTQSEQSMVNTDVQSRACKYLLVKIFFLIWELKLEFFYPPAGDAIASLVESTTIKAVGTNITSMWTLTSFSSSSPPSDPHSVTRWKVMLGSGQADGPDVV